MPEVISVLGIALLIALAIWLDDRATLRCDQCHGPKSRNERWCEPCEREAPEWLA